MLCRCYHHFPRGCGTEYGSDETPLAQSWIGPGPRYGVDRDIQAPWPRLSRWRCRRALQLAGQQMGAGHGHVSDHFDVFVAVTQGDSEAPMATDVDANCFDVAQGLRDRHASPGRGICSSEPCGSPWSNGGGHRHLAASRWLLQGLRGDPA